MLRFIKKTLKAFAIHIVRRSDYYKELNDAFGELWVYTRLNNDINWKNVDKNSLYGKCLDVHSKHKNNGNHYV